MTTPQPAALPELPEPGYVREDGHDEYGYATYGRAYTADQMRAYALAALQPQPAAAVSDEEINRIVWEHTRLNPNQAADSGLMLCIRNAVRAILALRPQAVPMTDGTARQFVEWMKSQPEDREPTTIDGALAEFEAHHGITAQGAQGGEG